MLKLSDFRMIFGLLLRPLASLMSRHEYRVYQRLDGINSIPALGPRWGWRGYLHRYIEGQTLHEITPDGTLPDRFFDELASILSAVHARNVWYVDMNKRGNIICSTDGHPSLIDFQISVAFPTKRRLARATMDAAFSSVDPRRFLSSL
ncbi:MAG: hypothetical protein D6690_16850 [Nitrospirae bacterium]|nr:MAG: hypothetical protein D6690_16850 [Nitrospirota bacterium]